MINILNTSSYMYVLQYREGKAKQLWSKYQGILAECDRSLQQIKSINLPAVYSDILKATDAGPGVGCSNLEVRFRDVEIARVHDSDRVNRVHRARDDSGQNEAERSNAAIGNFHFHFCIFWDVL